MVCDARECTEWLDGFLSQSGFWARAQDIVVRSFGLGTGAFALWADSGGSSVRIRHYDARMVVPLTWDAEGLPNERS